MFVLLLFVYVEPYVFDQSDAREGKRLNTPENDGYRVIPPQGFTGT